MNKKIFWINPINNKNTPNGRIRKILDTKGQVKQPSCGSMNTNNNPRNNK